MRTCENNLCGVSNLPSNTKVTDPVAGDCKALICDTAGNTIEVEDSADLENDSKACTADSCLGGAPHHEPKPGALCDENGGKHCNDAGECVECVTGVDCATGMCTASFTCAPVSCSDGSKNGAETDTDCGGGMCEECATGKACSKNSDCLGGLCTNAICKATCTDQDKNNAETDVDCGGTTCPACGDGKSCASDDDCQSGSCGALDKCDAASCLDGIKNGAETGVDCGGPLCSACPLDHLVINEVDYDQSSTDTMEFVEIYNATTATVDMSAYLLVFIDGTNNGPYQEVTLTGMLAAGQYLVVGTPTVTAAAGALKQNFATGMNAIQNGQSSGSGTPDGIALIKTTAPAKLVDAISYEGAITTANLANWGLGTMSLVEGVALSTSVKDEPNGSLARLPNGTDTNNSAADWAISATPTPGAVNAP